MKHKFCSVPINLPKYDVTFALPSPSPGGYATAAYMECNDKLFTKF